MLRWTASEPATDDALALSEEQKQAGVQLHQLLRALASQKSKARGEAKGMRRFLPPIDDDRRNQVFLLDGARGSGKTALLVTILDLWNSLALGEALKEDPLLTDRKAKLDGWGIEPNSWPIVPVGMLDLQPLPTHTPVLLRIVECLVRVVEAMEGDAGAPGAAPPWHLADEAPCKSRKSWDALTRSIVAGWDHASPERWGKLDPEQSFHELDRAVRDYRDLPSRFDAFVGDLTADFKKWRTWQQGGDPLFVLAIDDADMVPERAAEVLDALRLLYHPRVAFVLTGDSGLFYRSREEAVARVLRSPRSGSDTSAPSPTRDPFAVGLARDIYDKVIPPSHRCAIAPIAPEQRHRYLSELKHLQIPARRPGQAPSPIAWLLDSRLVGAALPDRMRPLRELARVGRRLPSELDDRAALVRVALNLWSGALANPDLASSTRAQVDDLVQREEGGTSLCVSARAPRLAVELVARDVRPGGTVMYGAGDQVTVFVECDFAAEPDVDAKERQPQDVLGALVFAHNLTFEGGVAKGGNSREPRSGFSRSGAHARYELDGREATLAFAWPSPDDRGFLARCNVALRLSRLLDLRDDRRVDVGRAARWFVQLWMQQAPSFDGALVPLAAPPAREPPSWRAIAEGALKLTLIDAAAVSDDALAYNRWATERVLLLAAPESGLPPEQARELLEAFRDAAGASRWPRWRERASQSRAARMSAAWQEKEPPAATLLTEIDGRTAGHPWHEFMRASAPAPLDARDLTIQRFTSALRALGPYNDKRMTGLVEQLQALGDAELSAADEIARMVGTVAKDRNETADLLRGIWLRAVLASNGDATWTDYVRADEEGRPELQLPTVRFEEATIPRGTRGSLQLRDAGPFVLLHDGAKLPPLLQFLFPLVWDWVEGLNGWNTWRTPFASSPWTYRVSHALPSDGIDVPWPSTPWNYFFKYEVERRHWNERVDHLLAPRGYDVREARAAENAALYFLGPFCSYLTPEESAMVTATSETLRQNVRAMIEQGLKANLASSGAAPRQAALAQTFARWIHGVALLVTPESGAPERFRAAVLEMLQVFLRDRERAAHLNLLAAPGALHAHRLARIEYAIARAPQPPARSAEAILADLDAARPAGDPWVQLVTWLFPRAASSST